MKAVEVYPDIAHFILNKDIPTCKAGDLVYIVKEGGIEYLSTNRVTFPIYAALDKEWFTPVTKKQHSENLKRGFFEYCAAMGKTQHEAQLLWDSM